MDDALGAGPVRLGTAAGRWVLATTILASGLAFLDATTVNVALPAIDRDLDAGFAGLQWTVDAYLLALSALLLLGGALGDRFGRKRVFVVGLWWFTIASRACGLAPTASALVAARALQGLGAALLVPGSLAIVSAAFGPAQRGRAIGTWTGLSGVSTAAGPLLGGLLVDTATWRWIFLLNVPGALLALWAARHVPETRDPQRARLDVAGSLLAVAALGGIVYALIEGPARGWGQPLVAGLGLAGLAALGALVVVERRVAQPMLPPTLFRSRSFVAANVVTLLVYAALTGATFLVAVHLQATLGWSALSAGAALVPITVMLVLLSPRMGELVGRVGPRWLLTVGSLTAGGGLALLTRIEADVGYLGGVFPGVLTFGVGLATVVAPLTTTVLTAAPDTLAGTASGVNNAVARTAGLLAVALLPLAGGISGDGLEGLAEGFGRAMLAAAGLCAAAAVVAWCAIRDPERSSRS
ncbi:DHA2 family efflux MFS transporter permease subunit [Egibacter rhizosphaerae]|uniref:DHA2 family efflux MFS transporter permease subunit n=1 Tax=Egibacter rhizosphaerae TaxID=1670831 RepID=A0A411YH20_9ACTN|nr:MFS transporter [Egibacter rhizosphaerae]QBI20635.1 DHA2 family efflux MFS transporter permease subunit [Egibacter rhizosphaerae]